jgi:hypothetical protein
MTRAERGGCAGSLRRALIAAQAAVMAGLIAALAPVIAAGPLAAQTPPQVQQAAEDAIHRLDLQTELQKAAEDAIHRLDLQTEFPRGPEPLNWHFELPPETLWVVIAIAIGVLLYAFRDLVPIWRGAGSSWAEQEVAAGETTPGSEAVILEAADELAARGRFIEAMHMLLLQGLAHLRQRLDQQFSDSLTSREILHSTNLPEAARASLRDVVTRVELTYFGQQPAGLADYTACRESFNALARSLYGSAPA